MIDVVGVIVVFIIGFILIIAGNNIPDQSSIILDNTEKINKLATERWNCGEDVQCQKSKTVSIKALENTINTIELSQNLRDGLIMWGIILDGLMAVFGILVALSRR